MLCPIEFFLAIQIFAVDLASYLFQNDNLKEVDISFFVVVMVFLGHFGVNHSYYYYYYYYDNNNDC